MKLTSAHVRLFRNVVDSSEVAIEPDVTCFVGKNESGKTAFLEALWRLNPHIPTKFIQLNDYPRWRYSRDKKAGRVETTVPVEAVFELDEGEVARIQETFGSQALNSRDLHAHRDYENSLLIKADVNPLEVLKHAMQALPEGVLRSAVTQKKSVESIVEAWKSAATTPSDPAEKLFHDLVERSPAVVIGAALADNLPRFFYFGRYSELPGRFPLTKILQTPLEKLDDGERTARSLLELGGGEGANLTAEDYERRVAELEAAANMVTQEVLEYWTQNDRIRVSFDVDKQIESDSYSARLVERYMDVRLHDDRHAFTTNLGTRSSGFRWFFSFIVAFSEMEGRDEDVVILLDEPGLNLHARAQKDLLRFIEERLAPNHQVLFTTHSPFMVDPAHLRRARLVEDRTGEKGAPEGSVITTDVLSIDRDTVFPLQGALGYDLAQHLLIGRENLVVEGTSDLIYLTTLSRHLQDLERIHLDLATLSVTPAGSAANVPTFVALLGGHLNLTVLVDSDSRANQRISDMVSRGMLHSKRLIFVGEITGVKQADIEDLFEPAEYLKLYNAAFGDDLAEGDLPPDARPLVKRIEVARSAFDHGRPAEVLMRKAEEHLPGLSEATLRRFEVLFEKVNASL